MIRFLLFKLERKRTKRKYSSWVQSLPKVWFSFRRWRHCSSERVNRSLKDSLGSGILSTLVSRTSPHKGKALSFRSHCFFQNRPGPAVHSTDVPTAPRSSTLTSFQRHRSNHLNLRIDNKHFGYSSMKMCSRVNSTGRAHGFAGTEMANCGRRRQMRAWSGAWVESGHRSHQWQSHLQSNSDRKKRNNNCSWPWLFSHSFYTPIQFLGLKRSLIMAS